MTKILKKSNSNWDNFVTLREYIETKLCDIEKATILASENLKVRLDSLNEWRLQNKDERDTFISRKELDLKFDALNEGRRDNLALILSFIAILLSIIMNYFK